MNHVGDFVSEEALFDGTILENISIGRKGVTMEDVLWACKAAGLNDFLSGLPEGLNTRLVGGPVRSAGKHGEEDRHRPEHRGTSCVAHPRRFSAWCRAEEKEAHPGIDSRPQLRLDRHPDFERSRRIDGGRPGRGHEGRPYRR